MKSNFDFLKNIDDALYSAIIDAEKLFRDEYLSQCCVQVRIFAERIAKKALGEERSEATFDEIINCLKDRIKTEREKEFIEDLFFIKREGNKCAHGEQTTLSSTLEVLRRAFEISISYAYMLKKNSKIDKLNFDETLLVTGKTLKEEPLVEKYVALAQEQKEELLKQKQENFIDDIEKNDADKTQINKPKQYKSKKKELTPTQKRIKEKVKEARKNIKQNINKLPKKQKKTKKNKSRKNIIKKIIFLIFVTISVFFLTKMIFFF